MFKQSLSRSVLKEVIEIDLAKAFHLHFLVNDIITSRKFAGLILKEASVLYILMIVGVILVFVGLILVVFTPLIYLGGVAVLTGAMFLAIGLSIQK